MYYRGFLLWLLLDYFWKKKGAFNINLGRGSKEKGTFFLILKKRYWTYCCCKIRYNNLLLNEAKFKWIYSKSNFSFYIWYGNGEVTYFQDTNIFRFILIFEIKLLMIKLINKIPINYYLYLFQVFFVVFFIVLFIYYIGSIDLLVVSSLKYCTSVKTKRKGDFLKNQNGFILVIFVGEGQLYIIY